VVKVLLRLGLDWRVPLALLPGFDSGVGGILD